MDPQFNNIPGLDLPQPTADYVHGKATAPMPVASVPSTQAAGYQLVPPVPQQLAPQSPVPAPAADVQSPTEPENSEDAATDIQDEEWIDKARDVIEQNRLDPYVQSRELGRLKAQYLKARFDKDIKVSKDKPQ